MEVDYSSLIFAGLLTGSQEIKVLSFLVVFVFVFLVHISLHSFGDFSSYYF